MIMKISDILSHTVKRTVYGRKISEAAIFLDYPELVGDKIARVTQPLHFKRGTMFIGVESPVWSHHLHFLKPEILRKLNSRFDDKLVKDIKFQICRLDQVYNSDTAEPAPRFVDIPVPDKTLEMINNICQYIEDEALRKGFAQLMTKDAKYKLNKTKGGAK
jgi:hypothetical protein